jgi:uncharacterized membrane protein
MQLIVLYMATLLVFLLLDAVMLTRVLRPIFETYVSDLLATDLRIGPALVFYLFYIAGVLYFVSLPAFREGAPLSALIGGALLGAMAYGTYEFTNYATLEGWHWRMVAVDLTWGTVLTAVSAWAGVVITRAVT